MRDDILSTAHEVHALWLGDLDDVTPLDREREPFASRFRYWYGKDPDTDAALRLRFEPALERVTESAAAWERAVAAVAADDRARLGLTLVVDQLPRNMYRGTARMYAHDGLALTHAHGALAEGVDKRLSLPERLFAYVPLLHVEDLTLLRVAEARFESLLTAARERCPHNAPFYESALGSARRHREVVERFGRFPHRNTILGRVSTDAEREALRDSSIHF